MIVIRIIITITVCCCLLVTSGGQHLRGSSSDEPVLELSDSTLGELDQLIIEGDLLEVSLDETHHLWKIMKACQPSQAETQGQTSVGRPSPDLIHSVNLYGISC